MSLFSKNLRFLRKRGNHNQDEISLLFNKRANTIGNWENQKSEPSLTELMKLAAYFKVSTQSLLHADLEKDSMSGTRQMEDAESWQQADKASSAQKPSSNPLQVPGEDAFWLILREIRTVNNKLDLLLSGIHNVSPLLKSDKSSH